jgi:hypothetical protein
VAGLAAEAAAEMSEEPAATVAAPPPPPRSGPSAEAFPRIDERTALTVGEHRLKLGIWSFEYGITEHLSVGTAPPAWALRGFKQVFLPNLNVKFQFFARDPVWLSAQVAGYLADISQSDASGQLVDVPFSLFASVRAARHLFLHGEGTYVFVHGIDNGNVSRADIGGTMAARAFQGQLMAEVRVLRWLSILGLGRYQFYTSNLVLSGSGNVDAFTTATVDAELEPRVRHPWMVVGGVAFLFKYVHLSLGAGYGNYFIPGMDLPLQKRQFVPDASLAFLFTL